MLIFHSPLTKSESLLASNGSKASLWYMNVLFVCLLQNHALVVLSFLEIPELSSTIRKITTCWLGKLHGKLKHDLFSDRHSTETFLGVFFQRDLNVGRLFNNTIIKWVFVF